MFFQIMSKAQKIWMWIFIAMFALPELLWSPVLNFVYIIYKGGNIPVILRNNFLMSSDYRSLLVLVLFIQTIGALLFLIKFIKVPLSFILKIILSIIFTLLFIITLAVFLFMLMTLNIGW